MSQENVKKFYEELKANKAFADELNAFIKAQNAETAEQAKAAMDTMTGCGGGKAWKSVRLKR